MNSYYVYSKIIMETPTDCLVLMLQEREDKSYLVDNTIFIIYDVRIGTYIIRGKRENISHYNFMPYSFTCNREKHICDFIEFTIFTALANIGIITYRDSKIHLFLNTNINMFPYVSIFRLSRYNRNRRQAYNGR